MGNLVSECIKNIMGIQRNPRDQNYHPEDFQDDEDQEQWRQTLIYIGGHSIINFIVCELLVR